MSLGIASAVFYRPDALPVAQATVSEHFRETLPLNHCDDRVTAVRGVLVDPNFLAGVKSVFLSGEARDLVDPYLTFSFAGVKVSVLKAESDY